MIEGGRRREGRNTWSSGSIGRNGGRHATFPVFGGSPIFWNLFINSRMLEFISNFWNLLLDGWMDRWIDDGKKDEKRWMDR